MYPSQITPPVDPVVIGYISGATSTVLAAFVALVGVVYAQNKQTKIASDKNQIDKKDIEDKRYKNIIDLAEEVRVMLKDSYEKRILNIEEQLKDSEKLVKSLNDTMASERSQSRKKISKLEKKMIDGYNVIMKLLAILKENNITIDEELSKEIQELKPSDTQNIS